MRIPFNIPYTTGRELEYIREAISNGHLSGNGPFTAECHKLLEDDYGYKKVLLTSSCTDALEMVALLLDIKEGDEVIVPAYTFVSTALAFARQGATIIFADSRDDNPCLDEKLIEHLITNRTKAIVPVHYNGVACDMDIIMALAENHNIAVVEDAAHAFGASYKGKQLGTIGHFGCLSFHETKLIHCGEGGMLAVNDPAYSERAEVIWEKGTNRSAFRSGKVNRYEWIDTGSSFLLSDLNASFLLSQLQSFKEIYDRRKMQWDLYYELLAGANNRGVLSIPASPAFACQNYSGFYLLLKDADCRERLRQQLLSTGIQAVTHYLDLSSSPYITANQKAPVQNVIKRAKVYQDTLLRLPLFHSLEEGQIELICRDIVSFVNNES